MADYNGMTAKVTPRGGMRLAIAVLMMVVAVACAPIYRNHGYAPTDEELARITVGKDTRDTVATYIGRPGADFPVFTSMLKKNGVVRLMATSARGTHGNQSEVEVSAVWAPEGEEPCIGFTVRDIGRRLAHQLHAQGHDQLWNQHFH